MSILVKIRKSFTMVELIIVVWIVSILWVIAVMTMTQWVSKWKDTKRIADIQTILWALETKINTDMTYPIPDNYIEIYASWNLIWYQWNVWTTLSKTIWLTDMPIDPETWTYYVYSLTKNKDKYQLMAFLDQSTWTWVALNMMDKTLASINTWKIPYIKWNQIWIFLAQTTLEPVQDILSSLDVINSTTWYVLYFDDDKYAVATGNGLITHLSSFRKDLVDYDMNLTGYWAFDEWNGTTVSDYSSATHDAVLQWSNWLPEWINWKNANWYWLRFDWVDDYALFSSFSIWKVFSLSIWVRALDISTNKILFGRSNNAAYVLWLNYALNTLSTSDSNETVSKIFTWWVQNDWQHFVITRNNLSVSFYMNWQLIWTGAFVNNNPMNVDNIWAKSNWSTSNVFKWIIDEVRVYDDVLTAWEIKSLYDADK